MEKGFTFSIELDDVIETPWSIQTENNFVPVDNNTAEDNVRELKVRLDKWLWAARFFKTRALARSAVENGKILYDGQKVKPSLEIQLGANIHLNQGKIEKLVVVKGLSTRRKNTDDALELFEELPIPSGNDDAMLYSTPLTSHTISFPTASNNELKPKKTNRFLRRSLANKERNWQY